MEKRGKIYFNNKRGGVLIITLLIISVLLILGGVFVLRSVSEKNIAQKGGNFIQSFYIAEAGGETGLLKLDELINVYLANTVNITNPSILGAKAAQFVASGDGLGFLLLYVKDGGTDLLTLSGSEAVYTDPATGLGNGTYQFDVIITERQDPVTVSTNLWDFFYNYRIQATGSVNGIIRKVLLAGDFTMRVQKDNFAKFALFTDHHGLPSGTPVWFTDKTNFEGPIHTNERYNFAFNPSGTFSDAVTQQSAKARFYNSGSPILADADTNAALDVPTFNSTYDRGVAQVSLASSVQKQDLQDQARGGDTTPGNGIFVANDGTNLTGGIFARGNTTIQMGVNAGDNATYTITEGSITKIITVDISGNQTTVETVGVGAETYTGVPDGVNDIGTIIYIDGEITSLSGTIQRDTEVTVSSENNIIITDNVLYSDYTPAVGNLGDAGYVPPSATGTTNLFGAVSWGGDVLVGTSAPDDVNIHGVLMARNGVFQVDNYNDTGVGSRGTATLLGGAITQFYGAFGLFNGSTGQQLSGYGRNFIYDGRALSGKAPPYFPSMKTFIAFTNDITDKIAFQEGGF